jgi:hypothetical protein
MSWFNAPSAWGWCSSAVPEPSVTAVVEAATDLTANSAAPTLRGIYDQTLREPVPEPLLRLVQTLR